VVSGVLRGLMGSPRAWPGRDEQIVTTVQVVVN
jgi:hypothetical protein